MNEVELQAIVEGRVQGVGFRATVLKLAHQHHLVGFVKNLSNGNVQILAQGTNKNVEEFLGSLINHRGSAKITHIHKTTSSVKKSFPSFTIQT